MGGEGVVRDWGMGRVVREPDLFALFSFIAVWFWVSYPFFCKHMSCECISFTMNLGISPDISKSLAGG